MSSLLVTVPPLPQALGAPSSRIRRARLVALYILRSLGPGIHAGSREMTGLCLSRVLF